VKNVAQTAGDFPGEFMIKVTPSLLDFECKKHCPKIEEFIALQMKELGRSGIVIPISGGLDSSVVAALCANAVGKDKVIGLLLPEKKGNPEALQFAHLLARHLGIKTVTIDISRILKPLGTYRFFANRFSRASQKAFVSRLSPEVTRSLFFSIHDGNSKPIVRQGIASMASKHRIRFVVAYKYAEDQGLMEVGCAHKSEDLLGLFSKFGVDDNADVMPLKNLYRTQILQIARYLKVPIEIIERSPNPDMLPGIDDKYFDVLKVESGIIDLILYGLEQNMPSAEIARQLMLKTEKVNEIKGLVKATAHMRNHSLSPSF
jgi:NAD+ synthase